jgi:Leucine-rich repeat (LRR) protein
LAAHVEIESNFLTGTIPHLGALQNLVYLYLRRNTLSSNLDFIKTSNHKNLASIWLDGNNISQTIPTEIGHIKSLTSISIANAQLTGTIPTELGHLTNLQRLWLFNNQLTGKIPTELEKLAKLEVLKVEDNSVKGQMPSGLCTIIEQAVYQNKELSVDCEHVKCDCCSPCNSTARISDP